MRNPIENLGDYNEVRKLLQAAGGCMEALFKNVGDDAIAKAAPKIMMQGVGIGAGIITGVAALAYGGHKWFSYRKDRKQKLKDEPALKKKFFYKVENALLEEDGEIFTTISDGTDLDNQSNEGGLQQ